MAENELVVSPETPALAGTATDQNVKPTPETPPELPDRYKGKTPAELVSILDERERFIGTLGERIGKVDELGQRLNQVTDYLGQLANQVGQRPAERKEEAKEEMDYSDPVKSFKAIAEKTYAEKERVREQADKQRYLNEAQANFQMGRDAAIERNRPLYKDIEGIVGEAVKASFFSGAISKEHLLQPKTWETAARFIRLERDGWELTPKGATRGMTAPVSETPSKLVRPDTDDDEVLLDDSDREMMRRTINPETGKHYTEKEAVEVIKAELKHVKIGKNKLGR